MEINWKVIGKSLECNWKAIGKVTGNTKRGLKSALVDGKVVKNYARVIVGKTVDLVFP